MKKQLILSFLISLFLLVIYQKFYHTSHDATLLISLIFWTALSQGMIALAAAGDLTKASWILPVKQNLQKFYPFLAILPSVFFIFSGELSLYPWFHNPGRWLNQSFFISRNISLLGLTFLSAHFYVANSTKNSTNKNFWAVLYLISFVLNQSLIAFDWVMPLEYPWVSTLFGGYFFVEAFYAGIAMTAIFSAILSEKSHEFKEPLKDCATLIFGFSLFWAGLFFSQYLVIWYGNLPEEVSFFFKRFQHKSLVFLGLIILLSFFVIPFLTLIFEKTKKSPLVVMGVSLMILCAFLLEKIFIFSTVSAMSPVFICLNTILIGLPFIIIFKEQLFEAQKRFDKK